MITLAASLTAHQKGSARVPYLSVTAAATRDDFPLLLWSRWYTGAEADSPHAATVADDGSLIRARNDAGTLFVQRVASPGPSSTYNAWTNLGAVTAGAGVALAAKDGELTLVYVTGAGLNLSVRHSTDDGATWSAATTRATEASAIGSVAVAYNTGGDLCCFYTLGTTTTLKRLRRTGGVWAPSGTNWTRAADVASLTGVAATYESGDFALLITGTAVTTTHRRSWGALMGDGALPANAWTALKTVAEADAAGGTTFAGPAILRFAARTAGAYSAREASAVAVDRAYTTHPPTDGATTGDWAEPIPHEALTQYGLALASYDGVSVYATTPFGVWAATAATGSDDLSDRVLSCSYRLTPTSSRCRLELDNHDGALGGLPNGAFARVMPGGQLTVRPGYRSGAAAAPQYGITLTFAIDRLAYQVKDGKASVVLDCVGPWEALARWRAPQAWQVAAGAMTRAAIAARVAARAGLRLSASSTSADWTGTSPAFAIAPNEDGRSVFARLLAVVSDHVRPAQLALAVVGVSAAAPTAYSYGAPGQHGVLAFAHFDNPPDHNWVRAQGPDRYADAHDFASVYRHGPQLRVLRNLDLTTNARTTSAAAAALRRELVADPTGELVVPFNAGQELYDVVEVTVPGAGIAAGRYRVLSSGLDYVRGPAGRARYDSVFALGGL
jgi:hypothetical protein